VLRGNGTTAANQTIKDYWLRQDNGKSEWPPATVEK